MLGDNMAENVNDGPEVTPTFRDDDDPESQKVYSSRGRGAGLDDEGGLYEVTPDFSSRVNQLKSSLGSKPSAVVSKEVKVDNPEKPKVVAEKTTYVGAEPYTSKSFKDLNATSSKRSLGQGNGKVELEEHETEGDDAKRKAMAATASALALMPNPFGRRVGREVIMKEMMKGVQNIKNRKDAERATYESMKPSIERLRNNRIKEAAKKGPNAATKLSEKHMEKLYDEGIGSGSPFKQGGRVVRMASGGSVRGHGIEQKGRTKGKYC
jgi:hypothetical protein